MRSAGLAWEVGGCALRAGTSTSSGRADAEHSGPSQTAAAVQPEAGRGGRGAIVAHQGQRCQGSFHVSAVQRRGRAAPDRRQRWPSLRHPKYFLLLFDVSTWETSANRGFCLGPAGRLHKTSGNCAPQAGAGASFSSRTEALPSSRASVSGVDCLSGSGLPSSHSPRCSGPSSTPVPYAQPRREKSI